MKKQLSLRKPGSYLVVAVLLTSMILAAFTSCSSSGTGELDLNHGIISGYVVRSSGGAPVTGSTITAEGATVTSTATKEDGSYSMELYSGSYNLTASKEGHAESRIENVYVFAKQSYSGVDFVQFPVFNPQLPVGAPEIQVFGINEGTMVDGQTFDIAIHATGVNPIRKIDVRIGSLTDDPHFEVDDKDTLNFTWNSSQMVPPPSNSFLHIVVYDINLNRTERFIYLKTPEGTAVDLSIPQTPFALTNTFSSDLEQLSYRSLVSANSKLSTHDNNRKLPDLANITPRGTVAEATIYSIIEWQKVPEAYGYRISRAANGGQYKLIGNVFHDNSNPGELSFYDYSAELTPGKTYVYKIEPYNKKGMGSESLTPPVMVLEPFEVELVSPADLEINVPVIPTFTWNIVRNAGEVQLFTVAVMGFNDEEPTIVGSVKNETSLVSEVTLDNNKAYEWSFTECVAVASWNEEYGIYLARAFAAPNRQTATAGTHTFTTTP